MKRFVFALVAVLVAAAGIPAAWSFQPGERVTVGSINQSGVVICLKGAPQVVLGNSHGAILILFQGDNFGAKSEHSANSMNTGVP